MPRPFFPIHFLCLFYTLHTSILLNWEAYSVKISLCNSDLLLFLDNLHTCNIAASRINEKSQSILSLSHSFAIHLSPASSSHVRRFVPRASCTLTKIYFTVEPTNPHEATADSISCVICYITTFQNPKYFESKCQ